MQTRKYVTDPVYDGETVKPLLHRVVVELPRRAEKSDGGIFLPETTQDRNQYSASRGTIARIGTTAFKDFVGDNGELLDLKVGDIVLFNQHAGIQWTSEDGREFRCFNDEDIIGQVVEETEDE